MAISFTFNNPSSTTTCSSNNNITWTYSGPQDTLTLLVTNNGVPQSSSSSNSEITHTLTSNANPLASIYVWTVNVPQGSYVFEAVVYNTTDDTGVMLSTQSAIFVVSSSSANDSLTSCGLDTPSSPSSTSSSSSHTNISKAVIAGAVIGGVAVVMICAVGLFLLLRRYNKRHPTEVYDGGTIGFPLDSPALSKPKRKSKKSEPQSYLVMT